MTGIGATDCERIADELLAQPVNALTSLAYVAVALAILVAAHRREALNGLTVTFAVLLAAVGVGSVLFHGPQPAGARLLHDLPIVLLLLLMVSYDLALLRVPVRGPAPSVVRSAPVVVGAAPVVAGASVAAVASVAIPDLTAVLTGLLALVLAVLEGMVFRDGRRDSPRRHQVRMYAAIGAVLAVAGGLWVLGRTGGPLCDPDSALQPHGLWHVASAVVFGLWWWLALGPRPTRSVGGDREAFAAQG